MMAINSDTLLKVENLHTYIETDAGIIKAVNGVSFTIDRETVVGIVGESGCGKSMTALSIMQLLPERGKVAAGRILFRKRNGEMVDIAKQAPSGNIMRNIRGNEIAMTFQEPMTALNPVFTIGYQIVEAIKLHQKLTSAQAWKLAAEMLGKVGIASPNQRVKEYPYQLSGGMRQRVMIAIALSCNPSLLIADEPTTALDVTIQADILALLQNLQEEFKMSTLIITHDLGVAGEICDYVGVMYMGKIVEYAPADTLYNNPAHPYTVGLFNSLPKLEHNAPRLVPITGSVPDPLNLPEGCSFRARCPRAIEKCKIDPPVTEHGKNHLIRCWNPA